MKNIIIFQELDKRWFKLHYKLFRPKKNICQGIKQASVNFEINVKTMQNILTDHNGIRSEFNNWINLGYSQIYEIKHYSPK